MPSTAPASSLRGSRSSGDREVYPAQYSLRSDVKTNPQEIAAYFDTTWNTKLRTTGTSLVVHTARDLAIRLLALNENVRSAGADALLPVSRLLAPIWVRLLCGVVKGMSISDVCLVCLQMCAVGLRYRLLWLNQCWYSWNICGACTF